ncbi:MAG: hypothetical protein Q4F00_03100 [bacterium]|nr:hypothetical protein [bacterium]
MQLPLNFSNLKEARDFADQHTLRLLRSPAPNRATLRLLCFPGQEPKHAVCKDFFDTPNWYRRSAGRFLIAHEYGAYARLQGIRGIPMVYGRPHPDMMLMQYLDHSEDLWKYRPGQLPELILEQMRGILDAIHAKGVIHLDIGHDSRSSFGRETNFMWQEEEQQVYLIDPAGALYGLPLPASVRCALEAHDNLALVKIHDFFFPNLEWQPPQPLPPWGEKLFTKLKKI